MSKNSTTMMEMFCEIYGVLQQVEQDRFYNWAKIAAYLMRYRSILIIYSAQSDRLMPDDVERLEKTKSLISFILLRIEEIQEGTKVNHLVASLVRDLMEITGKVVENGMGWTRLSMTVICDSHLVLNELVEALPRYHPKRWWMVWSRNKD